MHNTESPHQETEGITIFPSFEPGQIINGYEIIKPLRRGGMGMPYLSRNCIPGLEDMQAVLKFPAIPANESREQFMRRWLHEVKGLLAIDHPNVVKIYDAQIHQGMPYIRMEYAKGHELSWMLAYQAIPEPHVINCMTIAKGLLSAIADIHQRGITHRDVKPQNIIIDHNLTPKLIDFGIVKLQTEDLTRDGEFLGTIGYMSPEVLEEIEDPRRDVWAAGMALYSMLTYYEPARDPKKGKTDFEQMDYFRRWQPESLELKIGHQAKSIDSLLKEMLKQDYEKRIHAKDAYELICSIIPDLSANSKTTLVPQQLGTLELFIRDATHMSDIEFVSKYGHAILMRADTYQHTTRAPLGASRWVDQCLDTLLFSTSKKHMQVIGRNPEADIRINHKYVSNKHAAIIHKDNNYSIQDLLSKNGTRVGDLPKTASEIYLNPGDIIAFGHPSVQYVFETTLSIRTKIQSAQETNNHGSIQTKTQRRICPGTTKKSNGQSIQHDLD